MRPAISLDTETRIANDVAVIKSQFSKRAELSREVCSLLFFRYGIQPTANLVYGHTRKGSMTDITRDVAAFWNEVREKSKVSVKAGGVPEDLLQAFGEMASQAWEMALTTSEKNFEAKQGEIEQEFAQQNLIASTANEQRQLAELHAEQAAQALELAEAKLVEAEQQLAVVTAEKDAAIQNAENWEKQAKDEASARKSAENQFSKNLNAERKARVDAEAFLKESHNQALREVDIARQVNVKLEQKIKQIESAFSLSESKASKYNTALQEQISKLMMQVGELSGQLKSVTSERNRLLKENTKLSKQPRHEKIKQ